MQYFIIITLLMSSACRLMEEPTQQIKSNYASGDIVFDAENIGKAAVKQCQDTDCLGKQPVSYTLHQVALGNKEGVTILQLSDLLLSFQQTSKTYTCLAPITPLGKLTLLWKNDQTELCYAQNKDKDYVRQFAVACSKEAGWQLLAKPDTADKKKFICQKEETEISSACFVGGNSETCDASSWPDSIKQIHAKVGENTGGGGGQPPTGGNAITGDTKLSEVKIMAEWKLYGGYGSQTAMARCTGITKEKSFTDSSSKQDVSADFREDLASVDDFLIEFNCLKTNDQPFVVDSYGNTASEETGPPGICVANNMEDVTDSLDKCTTQDYYIKITFEAR